jgi:hypothetical protein
LELVGHGYCLAPIRGLADDVDIWLGVEDHAQAGPDKLLVVGNQDANA